jgi:hypothetical protein
MSVERIFRQLHDRARWPKPPERVLIGATEADLRPATEADLRPATEHDLIAVDATALARWTTILDDDDTHEDY